MTGRSWIPDQPGDYHLEWMCALSDDVRMEWPRPGADRRASLRLQPDDDRTTRREERRPRGGTPYYNTPQIRPPLLRQLAGAQRIST